MEGPFWVSSINSDAIGSYPIEHGALPWNAGRASAIYTAEQLTAWRPVPQTHHFAAVVQRDGHFTRKEDQAGAMPASGSISSPVRLKARPQYYKLEKSERYVHGVPVQLSPRSPRAGGVRLKSGTVSLQPRPWRPIYYSRRIKVSLPQGGEAGALPAGSALGSEEEQQTHPIVTREIAGAAPVGSANLIMRR